MSVNARKVGQEKIAASQVRERFLVFNTVVSVPERAADLGSSMAVFSSVVL